MRIIIFIIGILSIGCQELKVENNKDFYSSKSPLPLLLEFSMTGIDGIGYKLSLKSGDILYWKSEEGGNFSHQRPLIITPSEKQWSRFFYKIKASKAASWEKSYQAKNPTFDGTHWECFIIFQGDRSMDVISYGNNSYPIDFNSLLAAFSELSRDAIIVHPDTHIKGIPSPFD